MSNSSMSINNEKTLWALILPGIAGLQIFAIYLIILNRYMRK